MPRCVLYCNPSCGHALAVIGRLRARGLPYEARDLRDPMRVDEVLRAYRAQGSPVLIMGGEAIVGAETIIDKLDTTGHIIG